jgi:TRAP-type C4-dicarboxylate transport system permease small subunit
MNNNQKVLMKIRGYFDAFIQAERYISSVILIIVTLITFVQVVMRFVFDAPFSWSEEVTLMFLVWFGYLCMAIDIYTDDHAALYFLYNRMSPVLRKGADLFRHGLLVWFFVEMIKYGWMLTKLNLPKPQPATRFSQGWLYAPLVVGGVLMLIYSLVNFISTILKPRSEYRRESDKPKTVEEITVERGGTV